jgi:hypothetical protein
MLLLHFYSFGAPIDPKTPILALIWAGFFPALTSSSDIVIGAVRKSIASNGANDVEDITASSASSHVGLHGTVLRLQGFLSSAYGISL